MRSFASGCAQDDIVRCVKRCQSADFKVHSIIIFTLNSPLSTLHTYRMISFVSIGARVTSSQFSSGRETVVSTYSFALLITIRVRLAG